MKYLLWTLECVRLAFFILQKQPHAHKYSCGIINCKVLTLSKSIKSQNGCSDELDSSIILCTLNVCLSNEM